MNFDIEKTKIVSFHLSEQEVRSHFLDFLCEDDNAPLDVAIKAKIISIHQEFWPIRCFDVTFAAHWTAMSVWEHREEYTEYETKVVYYDRWGKEHSHPGEDTIVSGTRSYSQRWRIVTKQMPITKYRVVIDHMEQTQGTIDLQQSFQPIFIAPSENYSFAEWVTSHPLQEVAVEYYNTSTENTVVHDLFGSVPEAKALARANITNIAIDRCEKEIPGNRFQDMKYSLCDEFYQMEIILFPTYHITYSYNDNTYDCFCAGQGSSDFFCERKPIDDRMKTESEQIKKALNESENNGCGWGCAAFALVPCIAICVLWLVLENGTAVFQLKPMLYLNFCAAVAFLLIWKYKKTDARTEQLKSQIETRQENITKIRTEIKNIAKNENMSEDEKRYAIDNILNKR